LEVLFGKTPATLSYKGLAPSFVGLYEFNITVPSVSSNDLTPVTFTLNGQPAVQTMYIAIQ